MRVLLACSENAFGPWRRHPCVGRLITPVLKGDNFQHPYTAFDNFAYSGWDERKFFNLLVENNHRADGCKWVACPDVVGDWRETFERFKKYSDKIRKLGYPLAYVLQDGIESNKHAIPWNDIVGVFLGGGTEFKLSENALNLCYIAKDKNKLVHIGRVNSVKRIKKFVEVADSFDGLSYSFYSRARLPQMLEYLICHQKK